MNTNPQKGNESFKVIGRWEKQAKILKNKYATLTDTDLKFETGKFADIAVAQYLRENDNSTQNKKANKIG